MGWDCRDTYDHPFCRHDCCMDKDFCRSDEVEAARGYYKDYPALDPTPPRGFWARLFWSRPSDLAAAKWRWEQKMAGLAAARAERRVYNLTVGTLLDLPHINDGLAGWEPRQRVKDPNSRPSQGWTRGADGPPPQSPGPGRR
jgi:hypothetical protein